MNRNPYQNITPEDLEAIQRKNDLWLRPCTPEQALRHAEQMRNAGMNEQPGSPGPIGEFLQEYFSL